MASVELSVEPVYTMTLSKAELLFIRALVQNPVTHAAISSNYIEPESERKIRESLFNAIKSVGV